MVVFEVSVNGQRAYAMAAGDFGMLTTDVMWARIQTNAGPIHEEFRLIGRGMEPRGVKHLHWPDRHLKVGDEVTIRIVDSAMFDEPAERVTMEEMRSKIAEMEAGIEEPKSN